MTKPRKPDPEALIRGRYLGRIVDENRAVFDQLQAQRDDPRRLVKNPCGDQRCERCYGDPEVAAEIRVTGGLVELRPGAYIGAAHGQADED